MLNPPLSVAILTCSDRCSTGQAIDTSGPALAALMTSRLGGRIVAAACIPDERVDIARQIKAWASVDPRPDLILTTGGTGFSPRDVTPEATASILERRSPGLLELARMRCYASTPRAYLSRGEAGTVGRSLVINLPGSQRGAIEFLEAMIDVLPHAIQVLRGDTHVDTRPGSKDGESTAPPG